MRKELEEALEKDDLNAKRKKVQINCKVVRLVGFLSPDRSVKGVACLKIQ